MCVNVRGKYKVYVKTQQDFQAFVGVFSSFFFWTVLSDFLKSGMPANACVAFCEIMIACGEHL